MRNCERFKNMAQARVVFFKEKHPRMTNPSMYIRGMQLQFDAWLFAECAAHNRVAKKCMEVK